MEILAHASRRRLAAEPDGCRCPAFPAFHSRDPLRLSGRSAAFRPEKELPPQWLPSECLDEGSQNYFNIYKSKDGGVAAVLWAVWMLASIVLLWLFFRKRKYQPLKFRTFSMTAVLWLNLTYMLTLNLANMAMDMTGSNMMELVVVCICLFIHLFVYIMKSLQLAHMYRWSEMKVTEEPSGLFGPSVLRVKQTRKDLMNYGASWKGMLTVAVLGTIMVLVTRYSVGALEDGDNLYSSTRCQWYTGVSDSTSASCPFPSCTQFLVFEDDSQATVDNCVNELNSVCSGPSEYDSVCDKCSGGFSCACQEEFQNMYMHGECGTFSEIPNYASCRHGYGASRILSGIISGILLMLVLATVYSYLLILHIKDKLCLHNECLFAGIVNVVCATLIAIYGIYDDFYIQTWEGLGMPLPWLLMVVMSFWCLGVSIAYPVVVCYFVRLKHTRSKLSRHDVMVGHVARPRNSSPSRTRKARQDIDALFDPNDPDEMQLRFCLHDKPALRIYLTFAVKELSVENIKFVDKVFDLRRQADSVDPAEIGRKALQIYNEHIRAGSPMEVNLPGRVSKQIHKIFEPHKLRRRSLSGGSGRHRGSLSGLSAALGIVNWHSHSHDRQDSKQLTVTKSQESITVPVPSRPSSPSLPTDAGDDHTEVPQWPSSALTEEGAPAGGGMRRSTAQSTVFDVELGHTSPRAGAEGDQPEPYFPMPTAANDVLTWFQPAVEEIKRLIIRDSWPRFQQTYRFKEFEHRLRHEDTVESSIRFLLSEDSDDEDETLGERKTESHTGRRSSEGMRSVPSMNQLFIRRSSTQTASTVDAVEGGSSLFGSPSVARRHSADTEGIQNPFRRMLPGIRRSSETLSYLGRLQQQLSFGRRPASLKVSPVSAASLGLQQEPTGGASPLSPRPRPATAGAAASPRGQPPTPLQSPKSPRRNSSAEVNLVPFAKREKERRPSDSMSVTSPRNLTPAASRASTVSRASAAPRDERDAVAETKDIASSPDDASIIAEIGPIRDSEDKMLPVMQLQLPENHSPAPPSDEPHSTASNGTHSSQGERSSFSSSNGSPRVILEERSKGFDLGPLSKEPFQPPRLGRRSPQPSGTFSWRDISSAGPSPKSNVIVVGAEYKPVQSPTVQTRPQPSSARSLTAASSGEWSGAGDNHPMTAPPAQHQRNQEQELNAARNRRSLRRHSKERSGKSGEWATREIPVTFKHTRTRTRSAEFSAIASRDNGHRYHRGTSRSHDWTNSEAVDHRHRLFSGGHETKSDTSSRDEGFVTSRYLDLDNHAPLTPVEDVAPDVESQPLSEAHESFVHPPSTPRSGHHSGSGAGSESASGDAGTPEVTRKHRQSNSAARIFGTLS